MYIYLCIYIYVYIEREEEEKGEEKENVDPRNPQSAQITTNQDKHNIYVLF